MRRFKGLRGQVHFRALWKLLGGDHQLAILSRTRRHPAVKTYGGRHHESIVVIGVFSDQVHAPRRAIHLRIHSKLRAKLFRDDFLARHISVSECPSTWPWGEL